MAQLFKLDIANDRPSLIDAYHEALVDGFNALVKVGEFDRESALTVVGFLSAATIALRVIGHETIARRFECDAERISDNWTSLETVVRDLCQWLSKQD